MTIPRALRSFLKEHHIQHRTIVHPSTYTAQQLAHSQHVKGEDVLKVVLLKSGDQYVMALLPACYKVDFAGMKKTLGVDELRLGTEDEIRKLFPDCEIGAIPPVAELYHLKLYADESLKKNRKVLFAAGTHREAMRVDFKDLAKWIKPKFGKIASHI